MVKWFKRLRCRLRKHVAPTVAVAGMTASAGSAGGIDVSITGITVNGTAAPDGTSVSIPYTAGGVADANSPLTGKTTGGSFLGNVPEDITVGGTTYNFGPAVIDGETVASAVAAFTRSTTGESL